MSDFCGNPRNHEQHEINGGNICLGVKRPVKEEAVIVEKWEPEKNQPAYPDPRPAPPYENGIFHSSDWVKGWYDGIDLKVPNTPPSEVDNVVEYDKGYEAALQHKVAEAKITPNDARRLLGLSSYDPEAAGEVRTTSSTGGMKGVKPERYSLIPTEALDIMARLYGFGAEKYEAHNWRKGYEWSKSFDSLFRHATSALRGEDIDPETGLPHLAGVVFHCFTLMVFAEEHPEFDDRWKPEQNEE